jgi:hypothetical protein
MTAIPYRTATLHPAQSFLRPALTLAGALFILCLTGVAQAADWKLNPVQKQPPPDVDESIRALMDGGDLVILDGGRPVFEIWLRKEVPLKSKPDSSVNALRSLPENVLFGVIKAHRDGMDYRGDTLFADTYTARFSLQPQDGNHLGTSDFPYFAALIPVKHDKSPDALDSYKAVTEASSRDNPTGHPFTLSLRPVAEDTAETPTLTEPAPEHQAVRIKLNGKPADGGDPVPFIFDLVFHGKTPYE